MSYLYLYLAQVVLNVLAWLSVVAAFGSIYMIIRNQDMDASHQAGVITGIVILAVISFILLKALAEAAGVISRLKSSAS